jgi:hypothetical protein
MAAPATVLDKRSPPHPCENSLARLEHDLGRGLTRVGSGDLKSFRATVPLLLPVGKLSLVLPGGMLLTMPVKHSAHPALTIHGGGGPAGSGRAE